MMKERRMKL